MRGPNTVRFGGDAGAFGVGGMARISATTATAMGPGL